jgi:hypothetical protein
MIDSPHGPHPKYGGTVSAPIFQRIAESAIRYLGLSPTIDPMPPVLVARRSVEETVNLGAVRREPPIVSLVADGPAGAVPDLRGLSARDAMRELARLGLTARIDGDGVVVSQDPAAGSVLGPGGVCRLVLDRAPARSQPVPSAGAGQP